MDESDIYLDSTGSIETFRQNTMAGCRNVLAEFLPLKVDWRMASAEKILPTSVENVGTTRRVLRIHTEHSLQ